MQEKPQKKTVRREEESGLPLSVNPFIINSRKRKPAVHYSSGDLISGIMSGDRILLSQAITLSESTLKEHREIIMKVIEGCIPYSGKSIRVGISGIPGVGKSTFIETLGSIVTDEGRKLAVLAVDPSSTVSKGSIMGDKIRMEKMSIHPDVFIRPSPSAGLPGGVAGRTGEAVIMCEAAGFNTIFIETVGVGQSEAAVHSMVDFFLLLMMAGAGDEIQGIKKGILEMADSVAITKADGRNVKTAQKAAEILRNSFSLFSVCQSGLKPEVFVCSAHENIGMKVIWETVKSNVSISKQSGYFEERRRQQAVVRMHDTIMEYLRDSFYNNQHIASILPAVEQKLKENRISSYRAATEIIDKYRQILSDDNNSYI